MTKQTPESIAENLKAQIAASKKGGDKPKAPEAPKDEAKADTQKAAPGSSPENNPAALPEDPSPEKKIEQTPETDAATEGSEPKDGKDEKGKRSPGAEKRINELVGELKAEKAERIQDKEKLKALEAELAQLRAKVEKPGKEADVTTKLAELEKQRSEKYLKEDKDLPREKKRELTRDELEEWVVEDPIAAQEWMADRAVRKAREREEALMEIEAEEQATTVIAKQRESQKRVLEKHPDVNLDAQIQTLVSQGKTIEQAREHLVKTNPKVKLLLEIAREEGAREKYALAPNGPELLMEEVERRLQKSAKPAESAEEREARIREEAAEAERQRIANVDSGLRSSNRGSSSVDENDPTYKQMLEIFKKNGKTKADLDRNLERRRAMNL